MDVVAIGAERRNPISGVVACERPVAYRRSSPSLGRQYEGAISSRLEQAARSQIGPDGFSSASEGPPRGAASSGNECDVRPSHPQESFDAPVSAEQLSRLFEPHRPVPSERASWAIGVSIQVDRPSIVEEQSVRRSDRDMAGRKKMALPRGERVNRSRDELGNRAFKTVRSLAWRRSTLTFGGADHVCPSRVCQGSQQVVDFQRLL